MGTIRTMSVGLVIILFWALVVIAAFGFILWRVQGDSKRTGMLSGISSVEHDDATADDEKDTRPQANRMTGHRPMSFSPQPDISERARQEREEASTESTMESPVYLGKGSTAVAVRAVQPREGGRGYNSPDRNTAKVEGPAPDSAEPEAGPVEAADTSKAEKTLDDDADSTFDRIVRADG